MDPSALMNQAVSLAPRSSIGTGGSISYGSPATYRARIEYKQRMVRTKDGVDKVSTARIFIISSAAPLRTDLLTLPDGTSPEIIDVEPNFGEQGEMVYWTVSV